MKPTNMTRFVYPRRKFLGGAGAVIGLPVLRSLMNGGAEARAATSGGPLRFVAYYVPNGFYRQEYHPPNTGENWTPTFITQPLAEVRKDVLLVSGLRNSGSPHSPGAAAFLTAKLVRGKTPIQRDMGLMGPSIDHVLAERVGKHSPIPALRLGSQSGSKLTGYCFDGHCAYRDHISWGGPSRPLPKITNPRLAFDTLFKGFEPAATDQERQQRQALRKSVLDYAKDDAKRLEGRLSALDRQKLDEYLTGIRSLEARIANHAAGRACAVPGQPPPEETATAENIKLMQELMVLAFRCDRTRIITYMEGQTGSHRNASYMGIGITGDQHDISHHNGDRVKIEKYKKIGNWQLARLVDLIKALKAVEDIDGKSVLDNTVVFFSSELGDGNRHNPTDMPLVLAGRLGGAFRPGRHVRFAEDLYMQNVFINILRAYGQPDTRFNDTATQLLPGLG